MMLRLLLLFVPNKAKGHQKLITCRSLYLVWVVIEKLIHMPSNSVIAPLGNASW